MKNKKQRQFQVRYHATAECDGTVIYTVDDDEVPKKGKGKEIDMKSFESDLAGEAEQWAEGYQSVCEPPKHGVRDVRPDWEEQSDDWSYFPSVDILSIEEVTAEENVVTHADMYSLAQVCHVPFGKYKPKEMALWGLEVDGFTVQVEAEPLEVSFMITITRSYGVTRVDANSVLKTLARGDVSRMRKQTKYTPAEMEQLFKLFN